MGTLVALVALLQLAGEYISWRVMGMSLSGKLCSDVHAVFDLSILLQVLMGTSLSGKLPSDTLCLIWCCYGRC